MEGFVSLYDKTLDSLKTEPLNERTSNLDGIYVMSTVNIISFIIFVLSLYKAPYDIVCPVLFSHF